MGEQSSTKNIDTNKGLQKRLFWFFMMYQFRPKYRWFRIIVLLCATISTIAWDVFVPYQFKNLVDFITPLSTPISGTIWADVFTIFIVMVAGYLIGLFCEILLTNMVYLSTPLIMRDLENDAFRKLQSFSYDFYANSFVGSLVAQLRRYGDAYLNLEVEITENILRLGVKVIAVGTAIYVFSPSAFLPVIIWAITFIAAISYLLNRKMTHDRRHSLLDSKVTATLADSVSNFLTVKVFGREKDEFDAFKDINHRKTRSMQYGWAWSSATFTVQHTLNVIIQIMVLYFALTLWSKGEMSLGTVVFLQMLLANISKSLVDIGNTMKNVFRALAKAEEMFELMELKPDLLDPKRPQKSKINKGKIVFDDLTFKYGEGHDVFSHFDLTIKAGQRVGLVGHSGAGKSSFVKLLLRFMDPQSGEIKIDGQAIHKITQKSLREAISYVPQEPTLFHRSLWDNIAYGAPNASEAAIKKVIRDSYLTELIERLPNGVQTMVGERGVKLSGGERQRVAIARAMLKKSPILILDEATSSLDSTSEIYIQKAFATLMKGRTTIVIAHRLSTIAGLDRILVLDDGKIVEDGTHSDLVKKRGGHYAKLYKNQRDGMLIDD